MGLAAGTERLVTLYADCSRLLDLRDKGVALDRISVALMRPPNAVERRWHQLRVVPNVRAQLRLFGLEVAEYPTLESADLRPLNGALTP